MKNHRLSFLAILLIAFTNALVAETVKVTRSQASEIFSALSAIEPGLTAVNAVIAADNLNALRPHVESLDKGKIAAQRQLRLLPVSDNRDVSVQQAIIDTIDSVANSEVEVDLLSLILSPSEITEAKIRPSQLAVIRRFLKK